MVKLGQSKLVEGYEEITNEFKIWKPAINDEIEGKIVKRQKSNFGYSFVLEKDDDLFLLPNHTVLEGLLERVAIGDSVKIVCTGKLPGKPGKNDTMMYKLFVKRS